MTKSNLLEQQAFDAMLLFLKRFWHLTKNQAAADAWDVGHYGVLDNDGNPVTLDPAAWSDWIECVEQAVVDGYVPEPSDLYRMPQAADPSRALNLPGGSAAE